MRPSSYTQSRDVEGLYARYNVQIPFLPTEIDEGLAWLRSKGWTDGEPFICLLVRDAEYLKNSLLIGTARRQASTDWSYHDYRDSDIETYIPAIQWLTEQGVWVIRMGKLMAKPLPAHLDHVIDYAFDEGKSDLLDIWLFANCTACISTGTGLDQLAHVYGRPLLFVNWIPLGYFWSFCAMTVYPKPMEWADTNELLSVHELVEHGSIFGGRYETSGILVKDMTPIEILSAVREFWVTINLEAPASLESKALQDMFWTEFNCWREVDDLHGWRHPDALIGPEWLRRVDLALASGVTRETTSKTSE